MVPKQRDDLIAYLMGDSGTLAPYIIENQGPFAPGTTEKTIVRRDREIVTYTLKTVDIHGNPVPGVQFSKFLDDSQAYYTDENGELKVDIRAAQEVRKIYDMYIETQSIRDIAAELRTNFSDIREILHDSEEYMQMKNKIVSMAKLKRVAELMAANVRGGAVAKHDTEDEIADARRRRKESKKRLEQEQQMQ
jgi:hypothetical protein